MHPLIRGILAIVLSGIGFLYGAFVIETIWNWYLAPQWIEAPSQKVIVGFLLLITLIKSFDSMTSIEDWREEVDDSLERALASSIRNLIGLTVFLMFGYVLQ